MRVNRKRAVSMPSSTSDSTFDLQRGVRHAAHAATRSGARIAALGAATALALGLSPTPAALADSAAYDISKSATYASKALFDAGDKSLDGMKKFKYKGKTYNCYDVQALGIDEVHERYYITRTDGGESTAFIFSAPFSATKGSDWKCVGMFTGGWLGHANSMCAVPSGKGTKLLVATNSSKVRCVYVPNANKPSKNIKKSTWQFGSYDGWSCAPRGIDYDSATDKFIVRNGPSTSNGPKYFKAFVFKNPTSNVTGTTTVSSSKFTARLRLEIPASVVAPEGLLAKKTKVAKVGKWARQDMAWSGSALYQGFSATGSGKYKGCVASNTILSWQLNSIKSVEKKYRKTKKKSKDPRWYSLSTALFDRSIKWGTQSYEVEGLSCMGGKLYIGTNEGYNKNFDKIRRATVS